MTDRAEFDTPFEELKADHDYERYRDELLFERPEFDPPEWDFWTEHDDEMLDIEERFDRGQYDETADESVPCSHTSVAEGAGYPERSGRCAVLAVCEDCDEVLGQVGWDSVL